MTKAQNPTNDPMVSGPMTNGRRGRRPPSSSGHWVLVIGSLLGFWVSGFGHCEADPFDPAQVPADARYVLHLDMDAARPTQLWGAIDDRLVGNEAFGAKVGQFELGSGMHFPRDLHDVTVYGRAVGDEAAVVLVHAKMNRDQLMTALQFADNYSSDLFGKYEIAIWDDDNRPLFAAFHGESTFLIARSEDNLKSALDVMDGKLPPLAADAPLAAGAKQPALAYVAATDLAALTPPGQPPNPVVKQIDHGWLTLTERPAAATTRPTTGPAAAAHDVCLHVTLTATTAEAAQRLEASAGGLKAMVSFAAMSDTAAPNVKFAAAALRTLKLTQAGTAVSADVSVGMDPLEQAMDRVAGRRPDPTDK